MLDAGAELSIAATKTYTCQLLAMYLIAWALGSPILSLKTSKRFPKRPTVRSAWRREINSRVDAYREATRAMCIGRGVNYATALEFGLKLMETCYVSTDRFSSADLMHGPIALIEAHFPVFLFAPAGPTQQSIRELTTRLDTLNAQTLTITDESTNTPASQSCIVLPFTPTLRTNLPEDLYTPIPYIIPAQLFAAQLAAAKGLDPDRPRTLSKVTRTM